jgi:DNA-directed RNA polymerase specialized sigma subunit
MYEVLGPEASVFYCGDGHDTEVVEAVRNNLDRLSTMERNVLQLRYGEELHFDEVAACVGLKSRQRAQQIAAKALTKLGRAVRREMAFSRSFD